MSEERQQDLLTVFIRTFCKYGLDGTTEKMLAKEANLSEAGLLVYFKNKEDIILKCYEFLLHNIMNLNSELVLKYSEHPETFVLAIFTSCKSLIHENRFIFQVMLHPLYGKLIKPLRINLLDSMKSQSVVLQRFLLTNEKGYAIVLLLNSALNNYILTQDEESFQLQMSFLLNLFVNNKDI